jgi:hypothetical protein
MTSHFGSGHHFIIFQLDLKTRLIKPPYNAVVADIIKEIKRANGRYPRTISMHFDSA